MSRMKFGTFMAPFHCPAGQDPVSAYQRDLEVLQHMDRLGFDEAWIGEHHSCGNELIPDPFMFITWAGPQTRNIKLGTGVVSLPYHNPLWTADRALFADNLLRGRFMLGLGPGALPTDATMIGISMEEQRGAFEEDVDVLMALLRGETVTAKTPRYTLQDARTQYGAYSDFDIVCAAIASPTGPRAASKNGVGLLSVGATAKGGFDSLALHWDVMQERGAEFGNPPRRDQWRLVGPMHLAETKEQAIEDVRHGLDDWADYTQHVLAAPHFRAAGATFEERVAWVNETGLGVIGTIDDAIAQIERLATQSGGFGSYLLLHHEWARPEATLKSYELFARHVKPRFQGTTDRLEKAVAYARSRWEELDQRQADAIQAATDRHSAQKTAAAQSGVETTRG
ncbi:LLM class flavin-dependent oxidoreductase [Pseudonocardia kujensis]|uniref:LLM class flavin-dependent oxidoreductase n=1 Tax=Pseudonocardia kujensis TaxID=1128675 RepID=UPI001E291A70|nr:LLM class flavin-dependent oxidoreductase [Pseudonocardia kujensis]MCE0764964.1 LLM class flavin-dependent oxidoreductase [Pseudonocardia kujensis]